MKHKWREKEQARALRAQGKSLNEIVKKLGVSKSSVSVWVRDVKISARQQQDLKQKEVAGAVKGNKTLSKKWKEYRRLHPKPEGPRWPKRSVESFFDMWSPDMAYVLGYFAADGTMYKNKRGSCYIGFTSTDRELIETVKEITGVSNSIETYTHKNPKWKTRYNLQIGSKKIYERLLVLGFTPTKSLTLKFPDVPNKFLPDFVRGQFDGDGGVYKYNYSGTQIVQSSFTSGSKAFLEKMRTHLTNIGGLGNGYLATKPPGAYALQYAKEDTRQLYNFMYSRATVPCLTRKREVFEKAFGKMDP